MELVKEWFCPREQNGLGGRLCAGWRFSDFEVLSERPHRAEGLITESKNPKADLRFEPTCLTKRNEIGSRDLERHDTSAPMALPCFEANAVSEEDHVHVIAMRETHGAGRICKDNRCRLAFHAATLTAEFR
jgi:hypothetical protein